MAKGIFKSENEIEDAVIAYRGTQDLESIGSPSWLQSVAKVLEHLNVQAALEADQGVEEFVRESLREKHKLPILVKDLITVELWRNKVLPIILEKTKLTSSFPIYMILFYEANVVNLFETLLFDGSCASSLDDSDIDLCDYVMRQLSPFTQDENQKSSNDDELLRQSRDIQFQIRIKCLSILYYLTEHVDNVSVGVSSRLVLVHDAPALCIELLHAKPWEKKKKDDGQILCFEGNDWRVKDDSKVPGPEILVWTTLWFFLIKRPFSEKYEIHSFRRNQLLTLLPLITPSHKILLPHLTDFEQALNRLEIGSWPNQPKTSALLIESIPEIRSSLLRRYEGSYEALAKEKIPNMTPGASEHLLRESSFILDIISNEAVQDLMTAEGGSGRKHKACAVCRKKDSRNLCSGCKEVRYCGSECQASHWPMHKKRCSKAKNEDNIQVIK